MSAAFIGCKISLISKSEIRYEGILYTIDTKESTIALAKVRSFGTEDRQTDKPVAPRNEVYEYIIFRASDIKDLIVDDPPASTPALSDPAIIQAQSTGTSTLPSATSYASTSSGSGSASAPGATTKSTLSSVLAGVAASAQQQQQQGGSSRGSTPTNRGKSSPVNVEGIRKSGYMNQNRSSNQQQQHHQNQNQQRSGGGYGGGRQQHQQNQHQQPQYQMQQNRGAPRQQQGTGRVTGGGDAGRANYGNQSNPRGGGRPQGQGGQRPPFQNRSMNFYRRPNNFQRTPRADPAKLEEYDFEKANLEFTELEKGIGSLNVNDKPETEDAENSPGEDEEPAYDKTKSFFDTISCEAIERSKGNSNRPDRQHERKLNQETFGVSGFRSYNRRGFGNRGYNRGYGRNNYSRGNYRRNDGNMNRRRSTNNGSASEGAVAKAQTVDA